MPLVHIIDRVIDVLAATHKQISMNTARESTDGVVNIFVETQMRTLMVHQVMKFHHFTEVRVERPQLQTVENIVKIFEIQGSSHEVEGWPTKAAKIEAESSDWSSDGSVTLARSSKEEYEIKEQSNNQWTMQMFVNLGDHKTNMSLMTPSERMNRNQVHRGRMKFRDGDKCTTCRERHGEGLLG